MRLRLLVKNASEEPSLINLFGSDNNKYIFIESATDGVTYEQIMNSIKSTKSIKLILISNDGTPIETKFPNLERTVKINADNAISLADIMIDPYQQQVDRAIIDCNVDLSNTKVSFKLNAWSKIVVYIYTIDKDTETPTSPITPVDPKNEFVEAKEENFTVPFDTDKIEVNTTPAVDNTEVPRTDNPDSNAPRTDEAPNS